MVPTGGRRRGDRPSGSCPATRTFARVATAVLWFRRDLRLDDHPALTAAVAAAGEVVPLFVLDPALTRPSGAPRLAFLAGCLAELRNRTGGALVVRSGDPVEEVPRLAAEAGAGEVFATADFGPYGRRRDEAVAERLAADGRALHAVDSPYVAAPGTVTKADGAPFLVFSPYARAWRERTAGGRPCPPVVDPPWATGLRSEPVPAAPALGATTVLPPGEIAGRERLERFLADGVRDYAERRNQPATEGTSRLSPYLKYGCVHPRTVVAGLGRGRGADGLRTELAWRDFYGTILAARPDSARAALRPAMEDLRTDAGPGADERFAAWAEGRTGYPIVDAGMRQLRGEAWVHNRVRMIVASFLVKDLHLDWRRGARLFMERLQDGDLASNNHGWQWVAGTGTDPAPYVRVFNPVTQGERFDPGGGYVRRWVPELADVPAAHVHHPWTTPGGAPAGYPPPMVDHAEERREALARYEALQEA
jgi:deoxyribodipyrimidine photo-lyase